METLPRADEAVLPPDKLVAYCLDPDHAEGTHKARVFMATLGIDRTSWEYLRDQLLAGVRQAPVTSIRVGPWGTTYEVIISVDGLNGATHPVTTAWFVEGDNPPRLCSAYVEVP
jgi:hypothetical protein